MYCISKFVLWNWLKDTTTVLYLANFDYKWSVKTKTAKFDLFAQILAKNSYMFQEGLDKIILWLSFESVASLGLVKLGCIKYIRRQT